MLSINQKLFNVVKDMVWQQHRGQYFEAIGRNAIQRPDPIAYQKALCDVVKHEMDPYEAVKKYNLK